MKPLLLSQSAAHEINEVAARGIDVSSVVREPHLAKYAGGQMSISKGIATIDISGVLVNDGSLISQFMAMIFGGTLYSDVQSNLRKAASDPEVTGILLSVNSPGGSVDGVEETARLIRETTAAKPVVAVIEYQGASAAYWLAVAAQSIVAQGLTANVGSIGTVAVIQDRDDKGGKRYEIVSSQSPKKRPNMETDEGRAVVQGYVDGLAEEFIRAVAALRGVSRDIVAEKYGQGDILLAKSALAAGMIDRIGTRADAVSMLAQLALQNSAARSANAKGEASMPEIDTNAVDAARAEARKAERERIAMILNSGEAAGREALAKHLALDTDTEAQAAVRILAAAPKEDAAKTFQGAMGAAGNPDVSGDAGGGDDQADIDAFVKKIVATVPHQKEEEE